MPPDTLFAVAFRIDPGGPIVVLGVRVDVADRCVVRFDHLTSVDRARIARFVVTPSTSATAPATSGPVETLAAPETLAAAEAP